MLTVLDEYTRQALAVTVPTRMGGEDVLEAMYPLLYMGTKYDENGQSLGKHHGLLDSIDCADY